MKYIVTLLFMFCGLAQAAQLDAFDIMTKADERDDGESITSQQTLVLINSKNQKKVRQIQSYAKEFGDDTKSIVYLLQPAEVRNTAFLSYNWQDIDKEDENWMYLPALGRVDRLPASDQKNAFMGSDFSFADMSGLELNEWKYELLEESVDHEGEDCYKISAVPVDNIRDKVLDETGYEKVEHWVSKDTYIIVKSHFYLEGSSKNKVLTMTDIKDVDGILTPYRMTMKTFKGKRLEHASVLLMDKVSYEHIEDDNLFSTNQLRHNPI